MKKFDPAAMHEMSEKLMDYFASEGHKDFSLYVNNQCWCPCSPERVNCTTAAGTPFRLEENVDVTKWVGYSDPDTVSILFDGTLYEALNYGDWTTPYLALSDITMPYGLYFEFGTPFALLACVYTP